MEHWPSFLIGVAGSAHSLGTCGGFILSLSLVSQDRANRFYSLSLYSAGYVFTYVFLGALAGMAGRAVIQNSFLTEIRQPVFVLAGIMLVFVSLQMMGFCSRLNVLNRLPGSILLERIITRYQERPLRLAPFYLGLFNGFLPGPLVYAGLVIALASASVPAGMATMFVFALGTLPLLWWLGTSGFVPSPTTRARLVNIMAVVVLLVGCVMLWRGLPAHSTSHTAGPVAIVENTEPPVLAIPR